MILSLLLSLFIFLPDLIETNCHDHRYGVPSKSCKRIKDPKFQIRGDIKIVPMWEFILLQQSTGYRTKRAAPTHQNGTLHAAHSGGRTVLQPLPLPPQRWNPSHVTPPSQPFRHHTLLQPVDSNPPLAAPQRHIIERQVLPVIHPAPIYSLTPYSTQSNASPNFKRPDIYAPTAQQPAQYRNTSPNQNQGHQTKTTPRPPPPPPPQPYRQQQVTNYNHAPHQRPPYPRQQVPQQQQQVNPGNKIIENSNWSNKNGGKYQNPKNEGSYRNHNKNKKKGKKGKSSKMCKMCRELSEEEDSDEKEVACDFCNKSSKNKNGRRKLGGKRKNKGRNRNSSDESPEGQGGQIENITEDGDDDYYSDETTEETSEAVSQPTIIDFAERAEQNKLMRIPVYRGRKLETKDSYNTGSGENGEGVGRKEDEETSEFSSNIREGEKPTKYSDKPNVKYSYPPKDTLPLQTCFHNPSGYVCCNLELNNVVETTYKEVKELPNFNPCNLQLIANKIQRATEKMFGHPFESIVSHADFAQNINFSGDLVCKLEIDGKYMIAYGTPYHADDAVGPQGPDGNPLPVRSLKI